MFQHQSRLQHLLKPEHYFDPDHYEVELDRIFRRSWQFGCTRSEIANPGDFITLEAFGKPILIRNFDGQIKAFVNVCPHRHSMLTCKDRGNCAVLKCQYHGWEFNSDGRTGRIPESKAFRPWDRENSHLQPVRSETCGDLVFITLDDEADSLKDWLGPLSDEIAVAFGTPLWRMAEIWEFDCPCNWKIPTENTLESYHIAEVHPGWLGGENPSEEGSEHFLSDRYSTLKFYIDSTMDRLQARLCKFLGGEPKFGYRHWQIHPNLTFLVTDSFNAITTCWPTGPTTSKIRTRFYPVWGTRKDPLAWFFRRLNWRISRRTIRRVFTEDQTVYGPQQRGMQVSHQRGVIGTREERVYQFQKYVCDVTGVAHHDEAPQSSVEAVASVSQPK